MAKLLAERYVDFCSKAFVGFDMSSIVEETTLQDEIDFHKMHMDMLKRTQRVSTRDTMNERYPFLKIGGVWHVSTIKLYLYLVTCRLAIATYEDAHMQRLYRAIQAAMSYLEDARELDIKLTPSGFANYDEYTERVGEMYEAHCATQLEIFGKTPV